MVLGHREQIQSIKYGFEGLYEVACLIIEREVATPVFIPIRRHGEDPGGDALVSGVSIIMTCQRVAGTVEAGIAGWKVR